MKFVEKVILLSLFLLSTLLIAMDWSLTLYAAPEAPVTAGAVLYRINTGGPALPAVDGSTPGWSADTVQAPSPYVTLPVDQNRVYSTTKLILLDATVPAAAPMALFQTERWDPPNGFPSPLAREMRWRFPVPAGLPVEIRLYFAEIFPPINTPKERLFDVAVDGTVPSAFSSIDVFKLAGQVQNKGIMLSYVTTSDGMIDLDFLHTVENPQIKGIEIVEVVPVNPHAPIIANPIENLYVLENAAPTILSLAQVFTDAEDGNNLSLTLVANTNPALATVNLIGSNLTLTYAPNQHGSTLITIRATDSTNLFIEGSFVVTVNGKPTLTPIPNQTINPEESLNLVLSAVDSESDAITLTATTLPAGAIFFDNQNGTANFHWIPTFNDVGTHTVTVTVTDSHGQADTKSFAITVNSMNRAPVIDAIGNHAVQEGVALTIHFKAVDPDGDALIFSTAGLPSGATFTDNGNGTATITWTPAVGDSGVYNITVLATDSHNLTSTRSFAITVIAANANLPPILAPINDQTINEGATLSLMVAATDGNGDAITLAATGLPAGATFTDKQNGAGDLLWPTNFDSAGVYTITVTAQDVHGATDTQRFQLTVTNVNRKPSITVTGNQSVVEGGTLTVKITATDPDGDKITLKATNVPNTATFTDHKNGTATFTWPTTVGDAGSYQIILTAIDAPNAMVALDLMLTVNPKVVGTEANQTFLPLISR